jgi:hypothetical protein
MNTGLFLAVQLKQNAPFMFLVVTIKLLDKELTVPQITASPLILWLAQKIYT